MKIRNARNADKVVGIALSQMRLVTFSVKVISKTSGGKMNTTFAPTENRRWMLVDDNNEVLWLSLIHI